MQRYSILPRKFTRQMMSSILLPQVVGDEVRVLAHHFVVAQIKLFHYLRVDEAGKQIPDYLLIRKEQLVAPVLVPHS